LRKLVAFISSTADLKSERDAVEEVLNDLKIDASRFESWPSSPNNPISECLKQVEESYAFILLLGKKYGNFAEDGLSATHKEYRKAKELNLPIFAYIFHTNNLEEKQQSFIDEVNKNKFRIVVKNINELKEKVKDSFLQEFTRCFLEKHSTPPELSELSAEISMNVHSENVPKLPDNIDDAIKLLNRLYDNRKDKLLHLMANESGWKFGNNPEIMNIVYMAKVNYSMAGGDVEKEQLLKAIDFWKKHDGTKWLTKYNQANAFSELKRYEEAIGLYKLSLDETPDFAECWKNLGSAYYKIDDISSSRKCYEKALEIEPQLFEALYCLAVLLIKKDNDPETAISYLNRIMTFNLSPIHLASVQSWKAIAYSKLGRIPEGVASAEDSIINSPDSFWTWAVAGRLYALIKNEDSTWLVKAADFWKRFLNKYPDKAEAWAESGLVYWSLYGDKNEPDFSEKSLFAFNKALELNYDDDGLVWDRIGHIHQVRGNWEEAEAAYRNAVSKNPDSFGYCLGVSLIFLERYEEALPWVLKAAEKNQPDALSWFQVGVCYEKLGNSSEAVQAYEKAIELDPDYPEPLFNLGGLYWNKGDSEKAKNIWEQALKKFPDHKLCNQVKNLLNDL